MEGFGGLGLTLEGLIFASPFGWAPGFLLFGVEGLRVLRVEGLGLRVEGFPRFCLRVQPSTFRVRLGQQLRPPGHFQLPSEWVIGVGRPPPELPSDSERQLLCRALRRKPRQSPIREARVG